MENKYTKRPSNLFDASEYASIDWLEYEQDRPKQEPIDCHKKADAYRLKIDVPKEWADHINALAVKCRCDPAFLYRKALQAFFDLPPAIFDDDGYLRQWREVFELEGETALRPHIQECDDDMTRRIIRARNRAIKNKKK